MLVGYYSEGSHADALERLDKAIYGKDWISVETKQDDRELQGLIKGELEKLRKQ
jgi:hypothetical protein